MSDEEPTLIESQIIDPTVEEAKKLFGDALGRLNTDSRLEAENILRRMAVYSTQLTLSTKAEDLEKLRANIAQLQTQLHLIAADAGLEAQKALKVTAYGVMDRTLKLLFAAAVA